MNEPWIKIHRDKLEKLKGEYEETMHIIENDYGINLRSAPQLKSFIWENLRERIDNTRTDTFMELLKKYPENSLEEDVLLGIIYYRKMQYALKNYIQYFLTKESGWIVYLTHDIFGNIELPNHRPLPNSPEILDCILDCGNGLVLSSNSHGDVTLTKEKL